MVTCRDKECGGEVLAFSHGNICTKCKQPWHWWDYQDVMKVVGFREGIDEPHHMSRLMPIPIRALDQYPEIHIERGLQTEVPQEEWWYQPVWENWPVETIIVRPIVRWFGRG